VYWPLVVSSIGQSGENSTFCPTANLWSDIRTPEPRKPLKIVATASNGALTRLRVHRGCGGMAAGDNRRPKEPIGHYANEQEDRDHDPWNHVFHEFPMQEEPDRWSVRVHGIAQISAAPRAKQAPADKSSPNRVRTTTTGCRAAPHKRWQPLRSEYRFPASSPSRPSR